MFLFPPPARRTTLPTRAWWRLTSTTPATLSTTPSSTNSEMSGLVKTSLARSKQNVAQSRPVTAATESTSFLATHRRSTTATPMAISGGPTSSGADAFPAKPVVVSRPPRSRRRTPARRVRSRWWTTVGSGRSRMARMTLSREIHHDVASTVRRENTKPSRKPRWMLAGLAVNRSSRANWPSPAKMPAVTATMARPTPMPAMVPRAAAATAYIHPSRENAPISPARFRPTARSMPSSVLRSSASMTKIEISSRMPARALKVPRAVNSCVNDAPCACAASRRSRFTRSVWPSMPAAVSAGTRTRFVTSRERSAPSMTSPRFEMATRELGGEPTPGFAPASSAIVPGVTNRFGDWLPKPRSNPAMPRRGTTRSMVNVRMAPYAKTSTTSPGPTSRVRARS